jgi:autotransporter-associated beta strand protein
MTFQNVGWGRPVALVGALLLGAAPSARAVDVVVDSFEDDGSGGITLREAIEMVNASGDAVNTITFDAALDGQTILLTNNLTPVVANVEIIGSGATDLSINGDSLYQIFTITAGATVTITDLDLMNGTAEGGDGASRGGGGLGAGGALFVDAGSDVTIEDVTFDMMAAVGGDGGPDDTASGGGGGGTIGSGGSGSAGGAGGGGGFESDGDDGSGATGGDGGGLTGGSGGLIGTAGAPGGDGGGGGGAGSGGADGGAGGAAGGGGGASGTGTGGDGGFGGGGGGAGVAGTGGSGGFGAGDGSGDTEGDGGDGLGGAIFVREGGVLRITASFDTMTDTNLGSNTVSGGTGDTDGSEAGSDLYLMTGVNAEVFVADAVGGDTLTVAGTIAGDGAITKIGAGTLVYAGDNSYTGGTTVSQGILRVVDTGMLPGDVVNDSEVVFGVGGPHEYSGDMSGSGSLTKQGMGELTLTGNNSYSGGTSVQMGVLAGDSDALQGDIDLAGGSLRFDQPTNGTYAGDLSGAGAVEKEMPGTLTLTGDNSGLAGIFSVTDGAIQAGATSMPLDVVVANAALVIFDENGNADYSGIVSGAGDVTKQGSGRVTLLGPQTWAGATTVAAGELTVAGSLAMSDVTVQSGARLSGAGSIGGSVLIETGATIAPGDGIASFAVGATTFEAGSVYEVDLNPNGSSSDLLMVTGTLDLLGGTVDMILPGDPGLNPGESFTYEIANSTGLLSGVFDGVDEGLAFFDSLLAYPGNLVELTLTRNDETLVTLAGTRNQRVVGAALELARPTAADDLITVFDGFSGLSVPEVQDALDAVGGEGHTAFTSARIAHAEAFARTISSRMAVVSGRAIGSAGTVDLVSEFGRLFSSGPGVDLLTSAPGRAGAPAVANSPDISTVRSEDDEGRHFGLWLDGIGVFGDVDGDGNSADTEWKTGGVNAGLDLRIGQHGLVGIAGGWGHLDVDVDDRGFDGEADVYQGSIYGAWVCERFYISGLARYARAEMESSRDIVFGTGTLIDRKADADYDGNEYGGYVEAGYVVGAPSGFQIEPMAALHVIHLDQDSFTESGADSINLAVDDNDWTSIVPSGGIRVHKTFLMEEFEDLRILPELRVRFGYELGDDDRDMDALITGATTGGAFTVQGASMNRAGLQVGTGWSVIHGDDLGLFIQYDVNLNDDFVGHTLALGGVVRW